MVRAIRGAITIDENTKEEIKLHTQTLISKMISINKINLDKAISILFTTTKDVDAAYPALAVREMGISNIPLMCFNEMRVPNSLSKCIRVMIQINTDKNLDEINHVYLRGAEKLRPDLVNKNSK